MPLSQPVARQLLHQRTVICRGYRRDVGLRIGAGWTREVRKRVGGLQGCTHLVELLGPIATTAYQTLAGQRRKHDSKPPSARPILLDSCHALKSDGEVVKVNWPAYYTGRSTG